MTSSLLAWHHLPISGPQLILNQKNSIIFRTSPTSLAPFPYNSSPIWFNFQWQVVLIALMCIRTTIAGQACRIKSSTLHCCTRGTFHIGGRRHACRLLFVTSELHWRAHTIMKAPVSSLFLETWPGHYLLCESATAGTFANSRPYLNYFSN